VATTPDPAVLRITWAGHSTVLIELDGARLLTDPVFRGRLAHLRRVAPQAAPLPVGTLDAALISHLHYDHLDLPSLDRLGRSCRVVVPVGGGRLLRRRGFGNVTEVAIGGEVQVGRVTVRATPAKHGGRRAPLGAVAPAVGYLVDGSARVYFAGDTDLFDGMRTLAPQLDVALLPIGGWGARLPAGHLDPRRAAESLALLQPRLAVPIHFGTYRRLGLRAGPVSGWSAADAFARFAHEIAPDVEIRVLPVGGSVEIASRPGSGDVASSMPTG
jgi:L-ascorbate metabolism protein UlaG (beta-lactamase superfamily)